MSSPMAEEAVLEVRSEPKGVATPNTTMSSPSDQENVDHDIARHHLVARQNGVSLLLQILGGLLLAGLVASANGFIDKMTKPFLDGHHGWKLSKPHAQAILLAMLAYSGYLLNVFRQVHGLAIVSSDPNYIDIVDKKLSHRARLFSLAGLVVVLACPALLIALLQVGTTNGLGMLLDLLEIESDKSSWGPICVLGAYTISAVAYIVWDTVTLKHLEKSRRPNRLYLYTDACNYYEYIWNWRVTAYYTGGLAICLFLLSAGIRVGSVAVPTLSGTTMVLIIVVLSFAYLISDYVLNRNFYFGDGIKVS